MTLPPSPAFDVFPEHPPAVLPSFAVGKAWVSLQAATAATPERMAHRLGVSVDYYLDCVERWTRLGGFVYGVVVDRVAGVIRRTAP